MHRIGYGSTGTSNTKQLIGTAQTAEKCGFESFWVPETRYTRDAISPLAAISVQTTSLKLGSGVVNVYTRGPVLLAMTFATLDELSNGRMILGIATGSPLVLERQGISFDKPLKRLKEFVEAFRMLLRGNEVVYSGEFVRINGVALDFDPSRKDIPIYIGATGPNALRLAGRIADGIILNGFTSVDYARKALSLVKEGIRSAGRSPDDVDILSWNQVSVAEDTTQAVNRMRGLVTTYLVNFPNIAAESGVSQSLINNLREEFHTNGTESASRLVPDSVVRSLTVSGNSEECVDKLREYVSIGVKMPVVAPIGSDPAVVMRMASEL